MAFTAALLLVLPLSASAESWSCRHDNDVREVHIVQETGAAVPCSVVYKKLTEGVEDQVLWTANNDANYCLEKAQGLVDKQTGWGWTCVETIADESSAETVASEKMASEEMASEEMASEEMAPATEVETKVEAAPEAAPSTEATATEAEAVKQ